MEEYGGIWVGRRSRELSRILKRGGEIVSGEGGWIRGGKG